MPLSDPPFWLRLFPGGLGESHPAELLQGVADHQQAAYQHMMADHEADPSSGAPIHANPRWARAVACVAMPPPAGADSTPAHAGRVLWAVGFAEPPTISSQPTVDRPPSGHIPGTEPMEESLRRSNWYLNWRLSERAVGSSYEPTQTVMLGYELRFEGGPPPVEPVVLQAYSPLSTSSIQYTHQLWSDGAGRASLRIGIVSWWGVDAQWDDLGLDAFAALVRRIYVMVR